MNQEPDCCNICGESKDLHNFQDRIVCGNCGGVQNVDDNLLLMSDSEYRKAYNEGFRAGIKSSRKEYEPALIRYKETVNDSDDLCSVEKLRYFLSCALSPQDWLDVEPFIDDVTKCLYNCPSSEYTSLTDKQLLSNARRYQFLRTDLSGLDGHEEFPGLYSESCVITPENFNSAIDAAIAKAEASR